MHVMPTTLGRQGQAPVAGSHRQAASLPGHMAGRTPVRLHVQTERKKRTITTADAAIADGKSELYIKHSLALKHGFEQTYWELLLLLIQALK